MPVTVEQDEAEFRIGLEGEVGITSAGELKTIFVQALASGKAVLVDLERATELDATALQLFWAVQRESKAAGVRLSLTGPLPEAISAASAEAGFQHFPLTADLDLKDE